MKLGKESGNMEEERKAFESSYQLDNIQFMEDGKRIFLELRQKYPEYTNKDFDHILNGLCAALICLMHVSVEKDNQKMFLQLVYKILDSNCNR